MQASGGNENSNQGLFISLTEGEGGRGPRAYVGHLITFAISTLGKLTESLGPRMGTFAFFGGKDWALIACCSKAAILKR